MNTVYAAQWNGFTKFLHWTMVIILIMMGVMGLTMGDIESPSDKIWVYAVHKSLGLTALALALIRLVWRLVSRDPPRIATMALWQHFAAKVTHALLYVFMLLIPLSGWVMNSAKGYPLQYFKLFNLPALVGKNEPLANLAHTVHETSFFILTGLAIVHIGAAFYHHVFQEDDTLRRMLPGRTRQRSHTE